MLQREHSAILSTFIKLPFVIKIFVLSIFEWPFYTGFTVSLLEKNDLHAIISLYLFLTLFSCFRAALHNASSPLGKS